MAEAQTAIILVTDLVGSTALRSAIGEDAAEELRRRHDALLGESVITHDGVVVKSLGDGILARFSGAASAVASAVEMQQQVDGQFEIRVGVSAGDVTLEDGDCFGTPVIEASRLCDQAVGGQILVAELARMLARGRGGHVFEPVGDLELKGLPDPVTASRVVWERLESDRVRFPSALRRTEGLPFSGRVEALEVVTRAWKSLAEGERRILLLSGEPGMGKTRLAAELATIAHDDGGIVLFGRSDDEVTGAHRPFAEALGPLVADMPDSVLDAHTKAFGGALAGLVPELTARVPGVEPPDVADEETRLVMYDAVADLLARASQIAPVLLVLDDLHWADDGSVLLLRHLARARDPGAVLIVGTYRDTDLDRGHRLSSALADLRRVEGVERVALDGLDLTEVAALMAAAGGHELDDRGLELARVVHDETEGNPFFIGEILRHLAESGAIYETDGRWVSDAETVADLGVPQGIREVVGRRLDALPDLTNTMLRAAAVIGQEFDLNVLAGALDAEVDSVIDHLDPALDRNLLVEIPGGIDQLRFPHALVRQTLYEELSASRRVRLHARIADAYASRGGDHASERAHHLLEAAAVVDLDRLVDTVDEAAAQARSSLAWETAVQWLDRGLEALADASEGHPALEARLLTLKAEALADGAEYAAGAAAARQAAELAQAHGLPKQLARAAITVGLFGGWAELDTTVGLGLVAAAEAQLDPGESVERAELLVARAHLSIHGHSYDDAVRPALEGLDMVRRTGSPRLFEALLTAVDNMRGEPVPEDILELALEIRELDSASRRSRGAYFEALAHRKRGRFDEVDRLADELVEVARTNRTRHPEWHGRLMKTCRHIHHARWDDALAELARVELIDDLMGETGLAQRGIQRMLIGSHRGDPAAARAGFEMVAAATPAWGLLFPIDALLAEAAGTAAPDDLGRAGDAWLEQIWPLTPRWMSETVIGAIAPILRFSSAATLTRAAEALEPHRGLWLANASETHCGHFDHTMGLLSAGLGELDTAIELLTEGIEIHAAAGEVPIRARIQVDAIALLAERDAPGDRDRANRLAEEVVATCERYGIDLLTDRAAALLD